MKIHCVTLLIVDTDDLGTDGVREELESVRYPNDCLSVNVMKVETEEVEWSDDHPLNRASTQREFFDELFLKRPDTRCPGRSHNNHVDDVCDKSCCSMCGGPIDDNCDCRCE